MSRTATARTFTLQDQTWFAELSGDRNPMHLDATAARRTQAGAPVVHGVHTLLWCLERFAAENPAAPLPANLKVRFDRFLYLDQPVEAVVAQFDARSARLEAIADGSATCRVVVSFGPLAAELDIAAPDIARREAPALDQPLDLTLEQMQDRAGRLPFTAPQIARSAFPCASRWLGSDRVGALLGATRLVGMACPGLNSIFGGLSVSLMEAAEPTSALAWRVTRVDPRFRMVRMAVAGGGLSGTIESFSRLPPVSQPGMAAVSSRVERGAYNDARVLVVGGSRGLGEVTAKLCAAGGAKVAITYASGRADAERVADEIRAWGGDCEVLAYEAVEPSGPQLNMLEAPASHIYYFASPVIYRRKSDVFSEKRFAEFCAVYNTGFYRLCNTAVQMRPQGIVAFYPSSSFVEQRPLEMTEYAMAKAAGEILCADMTARTATLKTLIRRLPRTLTDQTASITATQADDALDVMTPIVEAAQTA